MKNIILFTLFAALMTGGIAQNDYKLDASERLLVIDSIVSMLNNNYVYPEVAHKMGELIGKNDQSGAYDDITDPYLFTERITADLRSVSHDKHLRLSYEPETIAMIRQAEENQDDETYLKMIEERLKRENYGFKEVKILPGNIGYIDLRQFTNTSFQGAGETAVAAMQFLRNTDAIIFDMTRNGGGSPSMIQLLTTYLYEGETIHINTFYWRPTDEYNQFWTLTHVPGDRMPEVDVYVLTSSYTFSGAEEFTYNLKNMERGVIVGETTGGGAHPVDWMIINKNFRLKVPMGKAINPITETNWEGSGIEPHYKIPAGEALEKAYILALDSLAKKSDDPEQTAVYQWIAAGEKAKIDPVKLDEKTALLYTGQYGPRKITYEDGSLFYQREERMKMKMIPMTETLFMFDGIDYFRLEVIVENGIAIAVVGHYDDGRTDRHARG